MYRGIYIYTYGYQGSLDISINGLLLRAYKNHELYNYLNLQRAQNDSPTSILFEHFGDTGVAVLGPFKGPFKTFWIIIFRSFAVQLVKICPCKPRR